MNLPQLYYFRKLAELQHYTNAAKELFITQPTLSNSIASLERELGIPLFRTRRAPCAAHALRQGVLRARARSDQRPRTRHRPREGARWLAHGERGRGHHLHHPRRLPPRAHQRLPGPIRTGRVRERVPRTLASVDRGPRKRPIRGRFLRPGRQQNPTSPSFPSSPKGSWRSCIATTSWLGDPNSASPICETPPPSSRIRRRRLSAKRCPSFCAQHGVTPSMPVCNDEITLAQHGGQHGGRRGGSRSTRLASGRFASLSRSGSWKSRTTSTRCASHTRPGPTRRGRPRTSSSSLVGSSGPRS